MPNRQDQLSGVAAHLEHGRNPVETGLPITQAIDLLENASMEWKERSNISVEVLRALCRLARTRPGQAEAGFTALEVREEVQTAKKHWLDGNSGEDVSKRVREEFKVLSKLLEGKAEHLADRAREQGVDGLPVVAREEGGGTGRPTRYFIQLQEARRVVEFPEPAPGRPKPGPRSSGSTALTIRYVCEDSREGAGIWRLLGRLSGSNAGRYVFASVGLLGLLSALALIGILVLFVAYSPPGWQSARTILMTAVLAFLVYRSIGPLVRVVWPRIVSAPSWLQSDDGDRLIEWRCPPKWPAKRVHLVRYSGTCPLCGGRVVVTRRSWLRPEELVGRCEDAPVAHVFSFDHVTRHGRNLSDL